jgi:uncharacterized membrane protein YhiD involved in acid resistance
VAAAIGMSVGFGFYFPAIFTTALVLSMLILMRPIEARLFHRTKANLEKLTEDEAILRHP